MARRFDRAASIEGSRALVRRILVGELNAEKHWMYLEDEPVMFALLELDEHDGAWLDAQLSDTSYPEECRALVRRLIPVVYVTGDDGEVHVRGRCTDPI